MKQRFLYLLLFAVLSLISCKKKEIRPNIIFIIMDDQNMGLSCFGKDYIHTPNMDRLASEGVRFSHAYVQQAVCAASRASFLTGLHPESTGVEYPYSHYFVEEVIPRYGTISQYFLKNGYYTRHFGKVHHGFEETLSEPNYHPGGTRYVSDENIDIEIELGNAGVPPYEIFDGRDTLFQDGRIARAALQALEKAAQKEEPFFFIVGFLKPHLPFSAPAKYWELYDRAKIPLAPNKLRPEGAPDIAVDRYNLRQYKWQHANPDSLFTDDYARLLRHAYFACTSFIDEQIGKIQDQVEALGLSENTYIVYISDHGFHLGEQNHWGKTTLYETDLNAPLIISGKGMKNSGSESRALVEYVDIMPTLLQLAGIEVPRHLEGVSLLPLLEDPDRDFKRAVFSNQERDAIGRKKGFSMREERYRYTEWRNTTTGEVLANELYDLQEDPLETVNLASDPANAALIKNLAGQLSTGWKAALPEGVNQMADNPKAPPAYAWGPEGVSRRKLWHEVYGGTEEEGWRKVTEERIKKDQLN
jgi:arylsulfatase A-like enzyme